MELTLSKKMRELLTLFLLIILPLILLAVGVIIGPFNVIYYLLSIFWFGMGLIFYAAINNI
ncbi:MAG: hypothetical protein DRN12_00240 [Thermoplasmata archaeon]|nr:MAG: hypothetical protein DRN12_00240 [Thermoplasmata archaeon]